MGELAKEGLALDRSEAGQKPGARLNKKKKKKESYYSHDLFYTTLIR